MTQENDLERPGRIFDPMDPWICIRDKHGTLIPRFEDKLPDHAIVVERDLPLVKQDRLVLIHRSSMVDVVDRLEAEGFDFAIGDKNE